MSVFVPDRAQQLGAACCSAIGRRLEVCHDFPEPEPLDQDLVDLYMSEAEPKPLWNSMGA